MKADIIAGIGGLMTAVTAWVVAGSFPEFSVAKAGPAFYPRMVAILFAVVCLLLIFQAFRKKLPTRKFEAGDLKKIAVVCIILIAYYFGMKALGYFTATFLAGFIMALFVFHKIDKNTVILSASTAFIICVGIYGIFQILLKAPLPRGILF